MVPYPTGNGSIDLIIPGVHKANGLRQLQKLRGIDDSEVVVFGDGGNDIEMPRQAALVLNGKMPAARSSQRQNTAAAPITVKAYWM